MATIKKQGFIFYFYPMKFWRVFLLALLFCIGCSSPKTKPQAPNVNWTEMDEPPLYPDCPKDNTEENWSCFTEIIQNKLDKKFDSDLISPVKLDTLYVSLKVDTIGQLSIMGYSNTKQGSIPPLVFSSVEEVVASLPRFQPAFKTNLEIPVEVHWTLPVAISE